MALLCQETTLSVQPFETCKIKHLASNLAYYGMRLMHLTKMLMISLGYGPSSLNLGPGLIDATYLLVDAHILVKCC